MSNEWSVVIHFHLFLQSINKIQILLLCCNVQKITFCVNPVVSYHFHCLIKSAKWWPRNLEISICFEFPENHYCFLLHQHQLKILLRPHRQSYLFQCEFLFLKWRTNEFCNCTKCPSMRCTVARQISWMSLNNYSLCSFASRIKLIDLTVECRILFIIEFGSMMLFVRRPSQRERPRVE